MATTPQSITDTTQLLGALKEAYAEKLKDSRVSFTILQELFPLTPALQVGNKFHVPILLTQSHGTTYDTAGKATAVNPAVAPQSQDAQIDAYEITERLQLPLGAIAKWDESKKVSFIDMESLKMLSMNKILKREIEWGLLYGQSPVAQFGGAGTAATTATIALASGSFGAGYLVGCENQMFDIFSAGVAGAGGTKRTNTQVAVCTAIDIEALTITLTGASADLGSVISGDYLWRAAQGMGNTIGTPTSTVSPTTVGTFEMVGLATQIGNVGTLFNINAANYSLFRGVVMAGFGNISVAKVFKMVAKARNRGADGELVLLVNAECYSALNAELAAQRRFDSSFSKSKLESGTEAILLTSSNGGVKIVEHPFVKGGDAFLIPTDEVLRPCVTDVVDNIGGEDLAVMSSTLNAYELRLFTSQAVFLAAPAHAVYAQGVSTP